MRLKLPYSIRTSAASAGCAFCQACHVNTEMSYCEDLFTRYKQRQPHGLVGTLHASAIGAHCGSRGIELEPKMNNGDAHVRR
jgi:hypothetical protein